MNRWLMVIVVLAMAVPAQAAEPPAWLPRYDLDIRLDPAGRTAKVKQYVTFTNRHKRPADELVFNAHARYTIPDDQVGFTAKMAEILRISPKEAFYFDGPPLDVREIHVVDADAGVIQKASHGKRHRRRHCEFQYGDKNPCTIVVPLAEPVGPGASVTVELEFVFHIPNKKGRWSHWEDMTALAQWLPTLAVYDDQGWHAQPFIPWHQPFYNEAGVYTAAVTLPREQKLAAPAPVRSETTVEPGWVRIELEPAVLRDFSLTCSPRYELMECMAGRVKVRCLHLPEHAFYARVFVETACQAIPVYERWFGPYPYEQFTIAEASFGWNGNECSAMVLIDERMFNMPHMAKNYPTYLIQHEICHQWFYNIIGTNGYAETFLDEGLATYFSHKLADLTIGKNNPTIEYPKGLRWMPNIHRDDLRYYGIVGSRARGEIHPTVQPIEKFGHLAALLAYTYDRGGKIFGLIEARLGSEEAMIDFVRIIYRKYAFRIFRVADLQRELEEYTGRSWEEFFRQYVHGPAMCDWKIDRVEVNGRHGPLVKWRRNRDPVQMTVDLIETEGVPEPTILGVQLTDEKDCFEARIPIDPSIPIAEFPEYGARIESQIVQGKHGKPMTRVRVVFNAPSQPRQLVVDPDRILLDAHPQNNSWVPHIRWRITPLYTMLDEVDVTNAYDRWSVIAGPWVGGAGYIDPWYTRSPIIGAKAGVVRIQELTAGVFTGYRTNDRNIVAGFDAFWSHVGTPQMYYGLNVEHALSSLDDNPNASRAALYGRYVLTSSSSLIMAPFEYVEGFAAVQNHPLPDMRGPPPPDADPFYRRSSVGLHYHKYYLTPYWDAEGGVALDVSAQLGFPVFGGQEFQLVQGQFSTVKSFPEWATGHSQGPIASYLRETRFAYRIAGAAAVPQNGQFFALGGGDNFRGFDLRERQGSLLWLTSVEWRVPILQNCKHDFADHVAGVRNVYLAPFLDVGQAYLNGQGIGCVASAVGLGLRVDVQWIAIIERTMIRLDVAQAISTSAPMQVWFGIQHPF